MSTTPIFGTTELAEGQQNASVTANNALRAIEVLGSLSVENRGTDAPPVGVDGNAYIVGSSPSGAWSGNAGSVAYYNQGWYFLAPFEGMRAWVKNEDALLVYTGSAWALPGVEAGIQEVDGTVGTITNSTTETAIYTYTVPAGALGTTGCVRLRIHGVTDNNSGASNLVFRLRVKLGATLIYNDAMVISTSRPGNAWMADLYLGNLANTSSQRLWGLFQMNDGANADSGSGNLDNQANVEAAMLISGTAAEDTTAAKDFEVTVQHNVATADHVTTTNWRCAELIVQRNGL